MSVDREKLIERAWWVARMTAYDDAVPGHVPQTLSWQPWSVVVRDSQEVILALAVELRAAMTENASLRAKLDTLTYAIEQCVEVQVCAWDDKGTPTEYTANLFGVEAAAPVFRPWFIAPTALEAVERAVSAAREGA